jgi:hypothetical protein
VFGFFRRRKEIKLMQDAVEIIGKAFILEKFHSDDAMKISAVSIDILMKNIDEIKGDPWVLAVRGMNLFRTELLNESDIDDGTQKILDGLENIIRLSDTNAYARATQVDKVILDSIYKSL